MTVIMHPIEVKCHSFNIVIAEPPYIDNEPPKRHISFLLVCNKAAMFVRQKKYHFYSQNVLEQRLLFAAKKNCFLFLVNQYGRLGVSNCSF